MIGLHARALAKRLAEHGIQVLGNSPLRAQGIINLAKGRAFNLEQMVREYLDENGMSDELLIRLGCAGHLNAPSTWVARRAEKGNEAT